ncbi:DUF1642 domain-containing protein [Aerococcus urinaeequi]|uniref:DUF1642 domain-containing protein n=1 Tax=Aerococcus urinaeequi TaxID=51665 RepID=UPI00366F997B
MKIEIEKPVVPQWFDDWYKSFYGDSNQALYHLSRTGWGHPLTDNDDVEVEDYLNKFRDLADDYFDLSDDYFGRLYAKEYLAKAILLGYEVEKEPLYYAKIKGWEVSKGDIYWSLIVQEKLVFPQDQSDPRIHKTKLTKKAWNKIGVNDTNADFEEVGE